MAQTNVGISDIAVHIPSSRIDLETIVDYRVKADPEFERRIRRAVEKTSQRSIRFPQPWEDSVTLATQAAYALLRDRSPEDLARMRYIGVGTETTVDQSKPIAAYVEGALQRSGVPIPDTLSTFQVQHACAGGTVAMLGIGSLLAMNPERKESGLVVTTDVSRYAAPSTAEITQGAGAVSLLVENNPKLVSLDLATQGLCSRDVDDFFRPNGSVIAKVKGGYSIQCYNDALDIAFADHCARRGEDPKDVLLNTDLFVLHVPFKMMAMTALQRLLKNQLGLTDEEALAFMNQRGFEQSLEPTTRIGNVYTASTFLAMAFLLKQRYEALGDQIIGKRVLLASYGSGNTMIVLSGTVMPEAPQVIASWDLDAVWREESPRPLYEYEKWLEAPYPRECLNTLYKVGDIPTDRFYLAGIREDGYRDYQFKAG